MPLYARSALTVIALAIIVGAIIFLQSSQKRITPSAQTPESIASTTVPEVAVSDSTAKTRIAEKTPQYKRAIDISTPDWFINTDPLTIQSLVGKKVILLDFWTYSCINCERTLPYLNSWYAKYKDQGLVIIGIHTPEFEFEKNFDNVKRAVEKFGVKYPVVLDNDYSTWSAYGNQYWPREYLIDIDGFVVHDHIGEGGYDETENKIVELLNERKQVLNESGTVAVHGGQPTGVDVVNPGAVQSPETYVGQKRTEYLGNLPSPACLLSSCNYTFSTEIVFPKYELSGRWKMDAETATLEKGTGAIRLRFSAEKVNLVAGASGSVRAKILIDGTAVTSASAGKDVQNGIVTFSAHDLYNLIDLKGAPGEHLLEIQFIDSGISAFAFTFG